MNQEEIDFWNQVNQLVQSNPTSTPLEYRLYHDETGHIYSCSMQNHPESGQYVVVDQSIYENYFLYRIIKGQPVKISHDAGYQRNLEKSSTGIAVVAGHAGLVIEPNENYSTTEHYEYRNN
jgi:hypothetical protein